MWERRLKTKADRSDKREKRVVGEKIWVIVGWATALYDAPHCSLLLLLNELCLCLSFGLEFNPECILLKVGII